MKQKTQSSRNGPRYCNIEKEENHETPSLMEAEVNKIVKLMDSEVRPLCKQVQEVLGQIEVKKPARKRSQSRQGSATRSNLMDKENGRTNSV